MKRILQKKDFTAWAKKLKGYDCYVPVERDGVWSYETVADPGKFSPDYPNTVCNGLWEYRPDFTDDLWRKGATKIENIVSSPDGLRAAEGKAGTIIWTMRSPYIFVGGQFEVEGNGAVLKVSEDGKKWFDVRDRVEYWFFTNWGPQRFHINSAASSPAPPGSSDWR